MKLMDNDWFFEKFEVIAELPDAVTRMRELVLDLAQCLFVTSAGLRTILVAHRRMASAGGGWWCATPRRRCGESST